LKATSRLMTDGERLTALAAWLDHASRWLEREVRDSRAGRPVEDEKADPEQRVETVLFLTTELDAMVDGLRRTTDVLAALAVPLPGPVAPPAYGGWPAIPARQRTRARLRLVE
jgi:hypothetical protein